MSSSSAPMDGNHSGFDFVVPRPILLQASMSSLQAAVASSGDMMHLSPLRYARPYGTKAFYAPSIHYPSPNNGSTTMINSGPFKVSNDSSYSQSTDFNSCTRNGKINATQSGGSCTSLQQAATQAGLLVTNNARVNVTSSFAKVPSTQGFIPIDGSRTPLPRNDEINTTFYNTDKPSRTLWDENHEVPPTWDPPIREAIFNTASPLPIYSPLTLNSNRSTPVPLVQDDKGEPLLFRPMPCLKTISPFPVVPIEEGEGDFDEELSYNNRNVIVQSTNTSPVKLSSASPCWEPQKSNKNMLSHGNHDNYYHNDSRSSCESIKISKPPLNVSNYKYPTKDVMSYDWNKKLHHHANHGAVVAPSPTFTVETAEMTLDPPSIADSYSNSSSVHTNNSKPDIERIGSDVPTKGANRTKGANPSSLAIALSSDHNGMGSLPSSSQQPASRVYLSGSKTMEYHQYPYCLPIDRHQPDMDQRSSVQQQQQSRCQSAPTLGRPTFNTLAKVDDDSQQRKVRVKTELCMHYENGRPCPFGANCTYAHGEEELQMTKLIDLHEAGLVDMSTYRIKPCLTWVATGSCPFGRRCAGLHDHRVGSSASQSWLPHTETQGNTIATDINVDGLHQKRLHTILYDNPFGDQFTLTSGSPTSPNGTTGTSTWNDLYRLVCGTELGNEVGSRGIKNYRDGWIAGIKVRGCRQVHPIYKIQIALKLRGTDPDWMYKYRPQHVVHDELCLVLQKRAFRVISNEPNDGNSKSESDKQTLSASSATAISSVSEISLATYNPRSANHILVHEIAFGPDSDPSVRGVALWFNISDADVSACTPQQAKRFRWKKSGVTTPSSTMGIDKNGRKAGAPSKPSVFDSGAIESFAMIRPHDECAFKLVTDILKFRLAGLKRECVSNMKDRYEALEKLKKQEQWLKERFNNQRRSWLHWAWPVNRDREYVDENTPVPPVEGPYLLKDHKGDESTSNKESADERNDPTLNSDVTELGKNVYALWSSFVTTLDGEKENESAETVVGRSKRLPVFDALSQGKTISSDRKPPHILKSSEYYNQNHTNKQKVIVANYSHQQERCWKALLLVEESNDSLSSSSGVGSANEWEIVREHFENSRSKKVLSIIQQ